MPKQMVKKRQQLASRTTPKKDKLFIGLTFAGISIGVIFGLSARFARPGAVALLWIGLPGELYLRILNAAILPVIVFSVIDGTASNDPRSSGRIGLVTFLYITIVNIVATTLGMMSALILEPGMNRVAKAPLTGQTQHLDTRDIFADFFRNLFPENLVGAAIRQTQTKYVGKTVTKVYNESGSLFNRTFVQKTRTLGTVDSPNIIGLVVCCTAVGMAAAQLGVRARPFSSCVRATYGIIMRIFLWIKWTGPVGVASLIAHALAQTQNLEAALSAIGRILLTLFIANVLHILCVLLVLYYAVTRQNPFAFLRMITKPIVMAVGPCSVVAALPDMLKVSIYNFRIDSRVATVVLPLCAVLNHDASGSFMAVVCISIAQFAGVVTDQGLILNTMVLAVVSTFAVPDVPSSSIVAVLIILKTLGIPPINIGLILAVDWLADRFRGACNVVSDMVAVCVVWTLCRSRLTNMDRRTTISISSDQELVPTTV